MILHKTAIITYAIRKRITRKHGLLQAGNTVLLTKDLDVKGSSIIAKRGIAVGGIASVYDNPKQIEGRVAGQQMVILTKFVKKSQ